MSRKGRETWGTRIQPFIRSTLAHLPNGLAMFAGVWQAGGMKKQAADQSFHDRRYQERKRAEAARKAPKKKAAAESGKKSSESGT